MLPWTTCWLPRSTIWRHDGPSFVWCLSTRRRWPHRLEDLGFRAVAEYVVLANRLVRPVEEAVAVAEGVRQPYPVS